MLNENRLYSISLGVASLQDGLVGVATALSPAMAGHFKFLLHHFFVRLGLTIPIRLYSPKPSLASPPRVAADRRPPGGKGYYLSPWGLITRTLVLVIVGEPMLRLDFLSLNLVFAQRIMVARTIKIDKVIGILKDRSRRSQSVFANGFELRVAVATIGQNVLGDHAPSTRRCHRVRTRRCSA